MSSPQHTQVLQQVYDDALQKVAKADFDFEELDSKVKKYAREIALRSEVNKGVLSVTVTLLTCKIVDPAQDIRYHYKRMESGFSARSVDTKYITPFMKSVSFPYMAESGWKTQTLAIDMPYDLNYPGVIKPKEIKSAFLNLIDQIQTKDVNPNDVLTFMFVLLINQRERFRLRLAKPHSLNIDEIIDLLERHFTAKYKISGAARLPTLAVYAAYQCMMNEVARYRNKTLCPLESHSSPDARSGRIGDIDVYDEDGNAFEGVEIKHGIVVTPRLVTDAYEKFKEHKTDRYYLLTTADMGGSGWSEIKREKHRIEGIHGCQVIVNGVYDTLKYYLRLLTDPAEFIDKYVELLKSDDDVKFEHKEAWNEAVSGRI